MAFRTTARKDLFLDRQDPDKWEPARLKRLGDFLHKMGLLPESKMSTHTLSVKNIRVTVEVANCLQSRQQGLMNRLSLQENAGMLFIFEETAPLSFWMKETYIPLSIAYLDEGGTITNIEAMAPLDLSSVRSTLPARYALEMNEGWFERNGVRAGDRIDLGQSINENLREANIQATGMCFPFAFEKAEEWFDQHFDRTKPRGKGVHPDLDNKDKFKVVHGTVTDKWKTPAKPIVHGWVEMGDLVFDWQTSQTKPDGVDKEFWYDNYQPEVYKEFTAEEALIKCAKYGAGAPWDDELLAVMQKRDAWMNESLLRRTIREMIKESAW